MTDTTNYAIPLADLDTAADIEASVNPALQRIDTVLLGGVPKVVTALPSTPVDGQEVYLQLSDRRLWHLKYDAGQSSGRKWAFIGGPPLSNEVLTLETTTSPSYTNLTTTGPTLTVPVAGEYEIELQATLGNDTTGEQAYMSYNLNGGGGTDANSVVSSDHLASASRRRGGVIFAASDVVLAKYRVEDAGTGTFRFRRLALFPVWLAG